MAIKGFRQEVCLSPIDEGETPEEDESSIQRYTEANTWLSPQWKAFIPYEPDSDVIDKNLRKIIYHYTTVIIISSLCVGPKRHFLPACLQDETLFHTLIFSTAKHAAWCRRVPAPPEVYFHKAQAIRLVNEKLSASFIETDTFDKSFDGMPEVLRIHWDGLILAVRMAGGLKNLGLSGITRRCALWADLATAMILKEKPRLLPPYPQISLFDYFGLQSPGTSCLTTAFGARIYVFTGSKELSQEASTVFWGLRSISELKAVRKMEAFVDTAGPDDIQYSDRTSAPERVLVPLWRVRNKECQHAGLLRIFAWVSLIYIYSELRDAPQGMNLYGGLAERIREEMYGGNELELIYEAFPNLLLWIFFITGRCANSDSKLYFARGAAKILAAQEVYEETDVELASRAFLWPIDKATPVNRSPVREGGNLPLPLAAGVKVPV